MVTARREGKAYGVEVSNGLRLLRADTTKNGKPGNTGMRPHDLLESALAACVCMSIDMAAERASVLLPRVVVGVVIERLDDETWFHVSLAFEAPLSPGLQQLALGAVDASPVARTLGKAVHIRPTVVAGAASI